MDKKLFEIRCTTCEARFGVMDSSLIGEIVACPKCGGMILVQPPQDYDEKLSSTKDSTSGPEKISPSITPSPDATFSTESSSAPIPPHSLDAPPVLPEFEPQQINTPTKTPPVLPNASEAPPVQDEVPVLHHAASEAPPVQDGVPVPRHAASETSPVQDDPVESQSVWNNRILLVLIGIVGVLFVSVAILMMIRFKHIPTPVVKQPSTATVTPDQTSTDLPAEPDSSKKPEVTTSSVETSAKTADVLPVHESAAKPSEPPVTAGTPNKVTPPGSTTSEQAATAPSQSSRQFMTTSNATGTGSTIAPGPKPGDNTNPEGSASPGSAAKEPAKSEPAKPEPAKTEPAKSEPAAKEQSADKSEKDDEEEFELGESGNTQASLLKSLEPLKKQTSVIDVKSRLAQPLSSIDFSGQSLAAAVRVLSGLSGVPITFDLDCMEHIRPLCSAPVQFRLEGKTVGDCLEETAKLSKLLVQEKSGQILLSIPNKDAFVAATFDLGGLASGESDTTVAAAKPGSATESVSNRALSVVMTQDELIRLVKDMISPESWESAGGKGTLHQEKQQLHVNQTADRNIAIKRLFEQLRTIRKLSRQTDMANELLVPEITCWDKLSQPMSLTYFENVPLMDPLGLIAGQTKLEILFDDAELARKGINRESSAAIRVDNIPVDQVLATLLTPLKLDYVVLGANLILITSQEAAREYKTFEVHLFAAPDAAKPVESQVRSLVEQIKSSVSPGSWKNNRDFIWYDMTSCCLLIRQSQPVQRQIRGWLERHVQKQLQPVKVEPAKTSGQPARPAAPTDPSGLTPSNGK